jgi:hypothetical protein
VAALRDAVEWAPNRLKTGFYLLSRSLKINWPRWWWSRAGTPSAIDSVAVAAHAIESIRKSRADLAQRSSA